MATLATWNRSSGMKPRAPHSADGAAGPLPNIASPVERMRGPGTSPDSTRSRIRRVFSHIDQVSYTLVKPWRVSISSSGRASSAAGSVPASAHFRWRKWTWLFQNPATTVSPAQSITSACRGGRRADRRPTAAIRPRSINTTASRIGASVGLG